MFTPNQIAGNITSLSEENLLPLTVAPKNVRDAFAAVRQAQRAVGEAAVEKSAAEISVEQARIEYETKAIEQVRADKPMPSREELDRAELKVKIAQQDIPAAELAQLSAEAKLAAILNTDETRDKWREAMQTQLEADQAKLSKVATEVIQLTNRINQLRSFSIWAGVWPYAGSPTIDSQHVVARALDEVLNATLWVKPMPEAMYPTADPHVGEFRVGTNSPRTLS